MPDSTDYDSPRDNSDDQPRRRRDDDDSDDRPRRRRPPPQEKSSAGLIIGIIVIGVLVLGGAIIAILIALLLPAVQKVRSAAARMQDQNNLKMAGLGIHNEHDMYGSFSQYARDRTGKTYPDHSWRVSILPYIEQDHLHKRINFNEPWDGPTNRSVTSTPIKVYTTPFDGPEPSANTPYRVLTGREAFFGEKGERITFVNITDGTSNTIMAAHAQEQVPWAAPRELTYSPNSSLPAFGHPQMKGGFNVLLGDASVRFIRDSVPERTMRALITRNGGEIVANDW